MPTTEFSKQKEELIEGIRAEITTGKELEALIKLFDRIILKKAAKAKRSKKTIFVQPFYSRTRVPAITSLQSDNNVTHEEALQQLHKMIETWK